MNANDKLEKFKKMYLEALKTNNEGKRYVELEVNDFQDLSTISENLNTAIEFLGRAYQGEGLTDAQKEEFPWVLQSLVRIIENCSIPCEMEGIDFLLAS